jgi:hypothetical protein
MFHMLPPLPKNEEEMDAYLEVSFRERTREQWIESLLRLRLPAEVAKLRAPMVDQDMALVGFALHPVDLPHSGWYLEKDYPVPLKYSIGDLRWNVYHSAKQKAMEGGFLTHGDFAYLSKCCLLGHSLLPDMWPSKFAADLRHPERHLDVLNEVWWLGRFVNARSIAYEPSQNGCKRPDWTFTCGEDLKLSIEIKRRPSTTRLHIGQAAQIDIFRDIAEKFDPIATDHLRLACITVYCPINRAFQERCNSWLNENRESVDAILCFSFSALEHTPFFVAPLRLEPLLSKLVLQTLDDEDLGSIGVVEHPLYGVTPREYAARHEL